MQLLRIIFCACFAMNVWNAKNLPFLSQQLFHVNGSPYDPLLILDENQNYRLDPSRLAEQGLPWLASSRVIAKISNSLAFGSAVTHVLMWYGKDIINVFKMYRVS
jgi:hypothetical protein